ncbi:MAG: tRNA (adenosine(37)-N6)-threonylcarbamoyltransferase complex dimerization subunit type 1 TsaB [Solirubrobacteraceae bacterium]
MRILAFDTATRATAVALSLDGGCILQSRDDPAPGRRPGHATQLLVLIVQLLERAGLGWPDVQRLAVGVGPGTFTGLRIGIATARALAQARSIPLVGVSTLRSLALNAAPPPAGLAGGGQERASWQEWRSAPRSPSAAACPPAGIETVLAVLDARRGEVFAAGWPLRALEPAGAPVLGPSAMTPAAFVARARGLRPRALAIGDGAIEFRQVLERSGLCVPPDGSELHRVSAANHCRLAEGAPAGAPGDVVPAYLRLPDAEIARRAAPK